VAGTGFSYGTRSLGFIAGPNITLSGGGWNSGVSSGAGQVTIIGPQPGGGGPGGYTFRPHMQAAGGTTVGGNVSFGTRYLELAAGPNIHFSGSGDLVGGSAGLTISAIEKEGVAYDFRVAANSGPGGAMSGGNVSLGTRELVLYAGSHISFSGAGAAGTASLTINGPAPGAGGGSISFGVVPGGGNQSGTPGVNPVDRIELVGGNNITLSQADSAGHIARITFIGPNPGAGAAHTFYPGFGPSAGGSHQGGSLAFGTNSLFFAAGPNITLSATGNSTAGAATLTISGPNPGAGGAGISSFHLSAGNTHITVNQNNVSAATIFGPAPGGAADPITISGHNLTVNPTTGSSFVISGPAPVTAAPITMHGVNLTVNPSTGSNFTVSGPAPVTPGIGSFHLSAGNTNVTVNQNTGSAATILGPPVIEIHPGGGISFERSGNSITISNIAAGGGGSTSYENPATVGLFAGANIGITPGMSDNVSHFTLSAPAGGGGYRIGLGSAGGGLNTTGSMSMATQISLVAGSNITLNASQGGSTGAITIVGPTPGVGGAADNRSMAPAFPIAPFYTTRTDMVNPGPVFWPFQPNYEGSALTRAVFFPFFSFGASANQAGAWQPRLAIYTRTGNTLSQLGSWSANFNYTFTTNLSMTNYNLLKMVTVPITGVTFDKRDYWMAYTLSRTVNSGQLSSSMMACEHMSGEYAGMFGAATNVTWQRVPGWGVFTNATSFPASVAFSQLIGSAATAIRAPLVYLLGFTV
jgi:hypothetical protein